MCLGHETPAVKTDKLLLLAYVHARAAKYHFTLYILNVNINFVHFKCDYKFCTF